MKNYEGQFEKEEEVVLRQYIKEPCFKELNDLVSICDLSSGEESVLQNIKDYIWNYLAYNHEEEFASATKKFLQFMESYISREEPCFKSKSQGDTFDMTQDLLEISNGYHISLAFMKQNLSKRAYTTNGMYSFGSFVGTDHNEYLAKRSMNLKVLPIDPDNRKEVDYNSIIAQCFFEYFREPVAEYYLLSDRNNPFRVILSKNFMKENQELVHFSDLYSFSDSTDLMDKYSARIALIESNIEMRYKNIIGIEKTQKIIDKLKLQYCKQEFMKLVIGPMDCNLGNTALLFTHKEGQSLPDIDISPAYDLDLSFNTAKNLSLKGYMSLMETSDGKPATISSFIKEFKYLQGFREFLEGFYKKIENRATVNEIVGMAYGKTNFGYFSENAERYIDFMNDRFKQVREACKENIFERRGDDKREAILE